MHGSSCRHCQLLSDFLQSKQMSVPATGQAFTLLELPNEIVFDILKNSELDDSVSLALSNRKMNSVAGTHIFQHIGFDRMSDCIQIGQVDRCPFSACSSLPKILDWVPPPNMSLDCCFSAENFLEELVLLFPLLNYIPSFDNFILKMSVKQAEPGVSRSSDINEILGTFLTFLASKGCKNLYVDKLHINADHNQQSDSIPHPSTIENMTCFSDWILSDPIFQRWFTNSCNESKLHSLSMVYVPQTAFILQLIHIPQYLEEFRLSFELQPLDSTVNHRAVPIQGVYEEWMRIPQYPQVLVDRGLADFLHRHRTITHLDLGIVSEVFVTNPRLCKPFPSTALPSLKIMRVHISFLPYMISTSTSLPALEEVELHITHREVQSTWGGADIPHDRDLYRAGMVALSRHGGRIQSLQISLFARVVSMAGFSGLFTLQEITLPGIEKFTIAAVEIDAAAKLTEMIAWVGRVLPDATELCIVKTKNWSRHRKRSFVSGVTQECPSIKKIGIDAEAKLVQDWLS